MKGKVPKLYVAGQEKISIIFLTNCRTILYAARSSGNDSVFLGGQKEGTMTWIKGGFELAGITGGLYIFYRGFMGVSYEVLNWVLVKLGYPE